MFTVSIEILCKLPPTSVGGFRAFANVCMSIDLVMNHSYFHLFYRFPNLERVVVVFRGRSLLNYPCLRAGTNARFPY